MTLLRDWVGGHSAWSERRGSDSSPVVWRLLQSHVRNLTSTTKTKSVWDEGDVGQKGHLHGNKMVKYAALAMWMAPNQ